MMRVFLLSPADCSGVRARRLLAGQAPEMLVERLRTTGVPLGEVFTFMSRLYFRGKLAYALRFACTGDTPDLERGVFVITPGAGLRTPETLVTRDALRRFAVTSIDPGEARYRTPLEAAIRSLAAAAPTAEFVLLGSVATPKYVDVLTGILDRRLLFPPAFVGRGDMSRGGLMLRHAAAGEELDYIPVLGAERHGPRPPRLAPLPSAR